MAKFLALDSSTNICSAGLIENDKLLILLEDQDEKSHAKKMAVFIDDILKAESEIDAIALSIGPGSYTGLRIGTSIAKALAYSLDIPIISMPTNLSLASLAKTEISDSEMLLCPMIDARRLEVYSAIYDFQLNEIEKTTANILDENTFSTFLSKSRVAFFGDGSNKFQEVCKHPNAVFLDGIQTSVRGMLRIVNSFWEKKQFVDVAYFEPFYLKDFIATTPKKSLLSNLIQSAQR